MSSFKWKPVSVSFDDEDPNFAFDFEEISDVDVEWTTNDGAKRAKLKATPTKSDAVTEPSAVSSEPVQDTGTSKKGKKRKRETANQAANPKSKVRKVQQIESQKESPKEMIPLGSFSPLIGWPDLPTHLQSALPKLEYTNPSLIQSSLLAHLPLKHDVIATSPTGSGKTFAYLLPILFHFFSTTPESSERSLALIITPTRELALQVAESAQRVLNVCSLSEKGTKKIVCVTGGLAVQKQNRLISKQILGQKEGILVATPGRLSELLEEVEGLEDRLSRSRFLILDEADKLVEKGRFEDLERVLRMFQRQDEDDQKMDEQVDDLRTLVFSATMEKGLMGKLGKRNYKKNGKKGSSTLEDLLERVDFRDEKPLLIECQTDIAAEESNDVAVKKLINAENEPTFGLPSRLRHCKIESPANQKDIFLYYFLLRYPGRSLVFLTSIDSIRRLHPLLTLLSLPATPLHSSMKQPMRLKSLESFKKNANSILLATDVAARGLDISGVDHVIHYQVPRTTESYVHRSGRTARAGKDGVSLLMVGPEEKGAARELERGLGGNTKWQWEELEPEWGVMDALKQRLDLAKTVEELERGAKKEKAEENWENKMKRELEIGSSEDEVDDEEVPKKKTKRQKAAKNVNGAKAQLKVLLSQPVKVRGTSLKYITGHNSSVVDTILQNQNLEGFVGVSKSSVLKDLKKKGT